ncbi:hypothetical protein DLM85_18440 [Hymenobacter edaphi]|uniref:Uncharacterized protein n=1 Tax=Hymenobacter edaphi TaxID=2211146 RepID=A0A328BC53_9BACT|nr:hypothetical protein DLM85_18440 [Hymenobacter edaphi]
MLKSALPLFLLALLYGGPAQAQVQVNVNVGAPAWGPPIGPGVQYYYIPEIDGYYDLYTQSYVYFDPYYNTWVSAPALPAAYYAGYDPRYFHPVVVQYVGRQPWGRIYDHRSYCNTRGWRPGYYRSAPGPRWQGGYGGNGYRSQGDGRYDNQPYAQNGPGRGGYQGGNAPGGRGGYQGGNAPGGRYDNDDRRGGGYDGRRDQPNGGGRPDYGQGQPGRGQGGFGGNSNGGNGPGGGRGRVR